MDNCKKLMLFEKKKTPITKALLSYWFFGESSGQRSDAIALNHLLDTGTVGSRNGHANFVAADSDYVTIADNSQISLGANVPFTWTLNVKPDILDGGVMYIMGKGDGNNNNWEYLLYLNNNKFTFRMGNGLSFVTVADTTVLSAGATYQVVFGYDRLGQRVSIKVNNGSVISQPWTGGTTDKNTSLSFGRAGNVNSVYFDGELWNAGFWRNRYLSTLEQASIIGKSYPFGLTGLNISAVDPDDVGNQHSWFDLSDVNALYTDSGKTTNVASSDDPIRVAVDKFGLVSDMTAPSDAARPLWKTNIQNSLAVGYWNGVDSRMDHTVWPAGDFTCFYVLKNLDVAKGSHVGSPNTYMVITGSGYDANPRFVVHPSGGVDSIDVSLVNDDEWNIIEIVRSGNNYALYCNGVAGVAEASSNEMLPNTIGPWSASVGDDWWADMYLGDRVRYSAALDAKTRARIRKYLADKWAITPVYYQPYVVT